MRYCEECGEPIGDEHSDNLCDDCFCESLEEDLDEDWGLGVDEWEGNICG